MDAAYPTVIRFWDSDLPYGSPAPDTDMCFSPILRQLTKRIPITKMKCSSPLFFKIYQRSDRPERGTITIALTGPWEIWIREVMFVLTARWAYTAFIALSYFFSICLWKKAVVCHTCGTMSQWNRRLHHPIFLGGSGPGTCLPSVPLYIISCIRKNSQRIWRIQKKQ